MGIADQKANGRIPKLPKVPKTRLGKMIKAWKVTLPVILWASAYVFMITFICKMVVLFWGWLDILSSGG